MRRLGAVPHGDGTVDVCVWAPEANENARVLRLRRGDATLVADFANRRVEFSRG